jgi:acyl-homoserine lactone acylase PvdQ
MAEQGWKWISLKSKTDGWSCAKLGKNKSKGFDDYKKQWTKANASNNTVYADSEGNIAYWHGNFILKEIKLNWSKVVDGTTSTTEERFMRGLETVHLYNPSNGWLQNCNSHYSCWPRKSKEENYLPWRLTEKVLEE